MPKLAIKGGEKLRKEKFPPYLPIGNEERSLVDKVFESNSFSRFIGGWHEDFFGGEQVQSLEKEWAEFFKVKYAIAVNSATSALYCAVGAIGTEPFDEIIVSPYTMCCSATAPLIYSAIPVFADVEPEYYCLDVKDVEKKITNKTKAIIVVDILGQVYNQEINALAKKHNLFVIEDSAQAPYATYNGKFAGTLGDIGIFSLNYHKHIHSGEGGILVTNNESLANKLRLIRNHGEAVVEAKGEIDLVNMVGYNYRMTEIEAAICREQLKKLPKLLEERFENIKYLEEQLSQIPCLVMPKVRPNTRHAYYKHGILFDEKVAGIHRDIFVEAVKAELMPLTLRETEGINISSGYIKPLYLQPMFQKKIAYGSKGFPWNYAEKENNVVYDYAKGLCSVVENLYENIMITHEYIRPGMEKKDLDDFANAFKKVWENIDELR